MPQINWRLSSKIKPITGLQDRHNSPTLLQEFMVVATEVISRAFKDETPERRQEVLTEVADDFERKRKLGYTKHPGATFRLAILSAVNGRCQICGHARLHMYTSDAGEKLCAKCLAELEEEINLGIKVRPPRQPEGGTDWLSEGTGKNP